ncbi:MAG: MFS transporter [Gammaproteobacteria bacterium]|nr:MFS transporter [Gammaproteobacteria bacterium]MCP5200049.1 MFS transporter [Gammaproteobacteria bacterium]
MPHPHPLRWAVLFGVWCVYMSFGLIATSLAPLVGEIERDLVMTHAAMGSVMGAWQLVYIVAAVPCGILLDRLGPRRALLLGALAIAASAWGRSAAGDYGGMLAAVMVFGIGGPIVSAGAPKVIASWFEGPERGFAMGIYITGPALGGVCSLTLTHAWLLPLFDQDWRPIFVAWAVLALGAGLVWFAIASLPGVRPRTGGAETTGAVPHGEVVRGLLGVRALRVMLVMSVGAFTLGHGFSNWLPEMLIAGGMRPALAGYWAALPTLVGIVAALAIPRLATPPRRFTILAALSAALFAATVLLQFHHPLPLAAGLVLQGMARSTLMTVLLLTLVELPGIGERHAGTAAGLFFAAAELGGMLGPLGLGLLYDWTHGFAAGLGLFSLIALGLVGGVAVLRRLAPG